MKKLLEYVIVSILTVSFIFTGLLTYGVVSASGGKSQAWDKSSLKFVSDCDANCDGSKVKVCNGNDSQDMQGTSTYFVYYAESGNAKDGNIVESGSIPALKNGECYEISLDTSKTGNYMVKALQRDGHPGTGVLWSEACGLVCTDPDDEKEEPKCPETVVMNDCHYTLTNSCK